MIVDTSAILAILFREPEAAEFEALVRGADTVRMSAASYLEAALRIARVRDPAFQDEADGLFQDLAIHFEPVTFAQAQLARDGFRRYGKGRHPAALNFGDCFVYALAKATGEPLLFKGRDFAQTDLVPAR